MVKMIKYLILVNHIHILVSSIINKTDKNVALIPKQARGSHHTGKGTVYGLHDAFDVCIFFTYLSKVNSGGKVVHWTRTLSQDCCSLYEPRHPTHLSHFCLAHIFKKACVIEENANYRGNMLNVVLSFLKHLFDLG